VCGDVLQAFVHTWYLISPNIQHVE
jgi:hypothetical protein